MKKIICLFLMFYAIVFAEWEVGTSYTKQNGDILTTFTTYGLMNGSYIHIGVHEQYPGFSVVQIADLRIKNSDRNIVLIITDNEGQEINCRFHEDDIKDKWINIISGRSSVLTKMLYNGKSAILIKGDEVLAFFDLNGIKQIIQKNVGSSYWFKYKLND